MFICHNAEVHFYVHSNSDLFAHLACYSTTLTFQTLPRNILPIAFWFHSAQNLMSGFEYHITFASDDDLLYFIYCRCTEAENITNNLLLK